MGKEEEITFKIQYREGMTMEELVNEINKKNDAMMTGFNAMMQHQTDLILDQLNDFKSEVNQKFDQIDQTLKLILQKLN